MKFLTSRTHLSALIAGVAVGLVGMTACTNYARNDAPLSNEIRQGVSVRVNDVGSVNARIDQIAKSRVVAVGEIHTRYDHHMTQLTVIEGLKQRGVEFAIGVEAFQSPFQHFLDAYSRGDISEAEMLDKTEYRSRWGYDYRLYRPIIEFAKKNEIRLVALNAPSELVEAVSRNGYDKLEPTWRNQLPKMVVPPDEFYTKRLRAAFDMHRVSDMRGFDRFLSVQLLWDEYMAEIAAEFLRDNPNRHLVILVGSGHLRFGSGIPERLFRRTGIQTKIVLSGSPDEVPVGAADVVFLTEPKSLATNRRSQKRLSALPVNGSDQPSLLQAR